MEWTPIMKIRFTKETLSHKPDNASGETRRFLKESHWLEAEGCFDTLVQLYRLGHTINISDRSFTDTLVLDLDHLTAEQASRIHDDSYIEQLCGQLHVKRIERFYSASHVYNKQKLFVNVDTQRDVHENKDLAYIAFRERFEQLTGIQCDPRMDLFTQITFGVKHAEAQGLEEPNLPDARPSRQPKVSRQAVPKSDNQCLMQSPPEEPPEERRWVPLNMAAYNKEYGKHRRVGGRFEWHTRRCYRGGWRLIRIQRGKRHAASARLIAATVYNALYQNAIYQAGFTVEDAKHTVWGTIRFQFDDAVQFLADEKEQLMARVASEWATASAQPLDAYYKHLTSACKAPDRTKYIPRDMQTQRLFAEHCDALAACTTAKERVALIGGLAQGDVQTMRALKRYCRKYGIAAAEKQACDYDAVLDAALKRGGPLQLPDKLKHNARFRRFLKERGVTGRIRWSKQK